jgi:hypothetical protein
MRARLTSTLFALSLLLTGCSQDGNSKKPLTDAGIAEKIVGTWKVDGASPSGVSASGTVSILGDGSLTCNTKFLRGERELNIEYTGTWRVEKGFLVETIKTTSNSNLLAVGFVTRDKILHLDNQKLVFETENGNTVTRNRSK